MQPSADSVCSRRLVHIHSQGCNGKDRAREVNVMNDMGEGHSPALLAKSTEANGFLSSVCCLDGTDFNDTIK